nr:uncharacterized protein LOC107128689 [Macaca fascicularis]
MPFAPDDTITSTEATKGCWACAEERQTQALPMDGRAVFHVHLGRSPQGWGGDCALAFGLRCLCWRCWNGLWFAMPLLALQEWLCGVLYGAGTTLPARSCWNGLWFAMPLLALLEWLCGVLYGAGTALPGRSCWNGCAGCAMVLGLRSLAGVAGMAVRSAVWCWDCAPREELLEWLCGVRYGAGTALPGRSCWNGCAGCAVVLGLRSPGGAAGIAVRSALWCWDCTPREELLEWLCGVRYGAGTALPARSCWNGCAECAMVLGLRSPAGVPGMAVRSALWCWDCAPREDFGSCL